MRKLMAGELTGCTCKLVERDDYSYVEYDEKCVHHRSLWSQTDAIKKHYEEAHKRLTNELRIKLVSEIIGSVVAASFHAQKPMATCLMAGAAIEIADAVIAELAKKSSASEV
jgi:hypothetical protein